MSVTILPDPPIEPQIEKITPAKASQMLAMNVRNRNVRKTVVTRYAQDMIHDRWHFNGAPILIGKDGTLYDGQHRLMAIVESGRTQQMVVMYGVDESAKYTIDSGASRTPGDILAFAGYSDSHAIAAVARLVMAVEEGRAFAGYRPSNIEIREWVDDNPDIEQAVRVYGMSRRQVPCPPSVVAAAFLLCFRVDPDDAVEFFVTKLINTEGLTANDPVKALRQLLANLTGKESALLRYDQIRYILRAWNFFREGRRTSRLQAPRGGWTRDNFPTPR